MAKSFSESEKINIKEKLISACEISWSKYGYKKTSIDELCAKAGISKGAFYIFYESKELLFCDTMDIVQAKLVDSFEKTLQNKPNIIGLSEAMKKTYREYIDNTFMFETQTPDFIAFINKLPKGRVDIIENHGKNDIRNQIKAYDIKFKIEEDKALSILTLLLSTLLEKDNIPWNHFEVFDFMIDSVLKDMFE